MKSKQNITLKLIDKFKNGDEKAFDEIVKLHYESIFNLLLRLVGNKLDADDLCQETFIRVYKYIKKFKGKSQFSTWLYRIAYNVANTPVRWIRPRFISEAGGTAATVVFSVAAS